MIELRKIIKKTALQYVQLRIVKGKFVSFYLKCKKPIKPNQNRLNIYDIFNIERECYYMYLLD